MIKLLVILLFDFFFYKTKNKLTVAYLNSYLYNNVNPALAPGHHKMKLLEYFYPELKVLSIHLSHFVSRTGTS